MKALNALITIAVLSGVAPADASLIWDGDASKGTGVFGGTSCGSGGSITAASDSTYGRIWRYYKTSASNRCESEGIRVNGSTYGFRNGSTYYFGWRSKLSSTVDNNANFQWKSYDDHIQNYPVILKMISGKMNVMYRKAGENCCRVVWSRTISANTWYQYALALHLSDVESSGWIEFWFGGAKQTLTGGGQRYYGRTHDSRNKPKWGTYGAQGTTVTNSVDGLKVGTAYGDVD